MQAALSQCLASQATSCILASLSPVLMLLIACCSHQVICTHVSVLVLSLCRYHAIFCSFCCFFTVSFRIWVLFTTIVTSYMSFALSEYDRAWRHNCLNQTFNSKLLVCKPIKGGKYTSIFSVCIVFAQAFLFGNFYPPGYLCGVCSTGHIAIWSSGFVRIKSGYVFADKTRWTDNDTSYLTVCHHPSGWKFLYKNSWVEITYRNVLTVPSTMHLSAILRWKMPFSVFTWAQRANLQLLFHTIPFVVSAKQDSCESIFKKLLAWPNGDLNQQVTVVEAAVVTATPLTQSVDIHWSNPTS